MGLRGGGALLPLSSSQAMLVENSRGSWWEANDLFRSKNLYLRIHLQDLCILEFFDEAVVRIRCGSLLTADDALRLLSLVLELL